MAEIVIKLANGEEAGRTLQDLSKNINKTATEMKKAEIGSKEFYAAQSKFKELKTIQEDLTKQTRSTAAASDTLKKSLGGVLNQIPGFSQLSGALSSAKGGVGGLTSGFGLLRGAIIATGIGALIVAVGALVGWFTKTEKGANIVSGAFKGMGAVLDTLMGRLWNIGDTLKQLFSDPIQFFKNLGNDIATAATEGYDFVQMMDEIEDKQRDMKVKSKENDILIDQLLLQAKNVTKTYGERLALLNKANELTKKTYSDQLDLAKENLALTEKMVAAELKNQGVTEMTGEQADRIADAKLEYYAILEQEIQIKEKIALRTDQILVKQADKEIQVEQVKSDTIDQIKDVADKKEEVRLDTSHEDKLKRAELELATDQNILNEQYLAKQQTEEQFVQNSANRLIKYHEDRLVILKEKFGEESEEYQKEYAKILDLQIAASEESNKITKWLAEDGGKALTGSLSVFGNAFSQIAAMHEQGSESWRTFAIAAATISAIQGAINAYSSTAAIPIVGTTLAPIAAGIALAAGMAGVAKIKRTKQPSITGGVKKKMRQGGLLSGPMHEQGGIPIEAEGGEFIFSRKAVRAMGVSTLNRLNSAYTFSNGGPVNPYSSRVPMSSGRVDSISKGDPFAVIDRLEKSFSEYAAKVNDWQRNIQVSNNLQDTSKGLSVLNKLKRDADV